MNSSINSTDKLVGSLLDNRAYSDITLLILGIRAAIGVSGNIGIYIAHIAYSVLHGSCNILLAAESAGHALYETGLITTFTAALIVKTYVRLETCLMLQLVSLCGANFSTPTIVFLAIDRVNGHMKLYLFSLLMCCFGYSAYVTVTSFFNVMGNKNLLVICTLSECYGSTLAGQVGQIGTTIHCVTVMLYILLAVKIKRWDRQKTSGILYVHFRFFSASLDYTRRIFNSLAVIVLFVIFNVLFNLLALNILPLFNLKPSDKLHISMIIGYLPNLAGASHAIVLYLFSKDYRKIFQALYIRCIRRQSSTNVITIKFSDPRSTSRRKIYS